MATWPSTLPQCGLFAGYGSTRGETVISTDMDAGQPKRRRRFTAEYTKHNISMVLTRNQWLTLRTFYDTNAAIPFTWVNPTDRTAADVVFVTQPQCKGRSGKLYNVTFSIEVQI